MKTVSFTRMIDGTREEYAFLAEKERGLYESVAGNVLALLETLKGPKLGYQVDRYEHSLQTATRALRDGADEETVVCALLHDVGDTHAPHNHGQIVADILKPYVSEENCWVLAHHPVFQGYYFWHHLDKDRNARDQFAGHAYYDACVRFCERWDQTSFDPDYDTLPIETFEPMVRRIFAREPWTQGQKA
jgi:predicted HD phosphohydrolase